MKNNPFSKIKIFSTFFLLFVLSSLFAQQLSYPIPSPEHYIAYKTTENIKIDGNLNEKNWAAAKWTNEFIDIIGKKGEKPFQQTRVKMLWDSNYFYVAAELKEDHIWAKLTKRDAIIYYDNDFEIFIDPDGDNHQYFELEINAFNTVWDLFLKRPYRDSVKANNAFDFLHLKTAVKIFGTLNDPTDIDDRWTIEIAIPWQDLMDYLPRKRLPSNLDKWRISFSRVQWDTEIINQDYIQKRDKKGKLFPEHNWVWSAQHVINMHRPETWGYVQFSTKNVGTETVEYQKDWDFDLKMALMEIYQKQKTYQRKHGQYASQLSQLQLAKYNTQQFGEIIRLKIIPDGFMAKANGLKAIWSVNKHGLLKYQDYVN